MVQVVPFPSSALDSTSKSSFWRFCWRSRKGFCSPFSIFLIQPTGSIAHETRGWHISTRSTDGLTTFEDIQFGRLKVAALVWYVIPADMIVLSINGTEEAQVNDGDCSFHFKRFLFFITKKKKKKRAVHLLAPHRWRGNARRFIFSKL